MANIFSTEFSLETVDSSRGVKFTQTWSNNMSQTSGPSVTRLSNEQREVGEFTLFDLLLKSTLNMK